MPTPPPRTGSATWTAQHHHLGTDARQELISFLGLDSTAEPKHIEIANRAMAEVEKWLGSYSGADIAHKNAPKPSDFVRSLSSIEKDTSKLMRNLKQSHQWILDEFSRSRYDLQRLRKELNELLNISGTIKEKYDGVESRGPPKKVALRQVILELREIFAEFFLDPKQCRRQIGFIQPRSAPENAEREFIKFALDDTDIPYTKEDLNRILDEPSMTVQRDMPALIDDESESRWITYVEINEPENEDK